MRKAAFISKNQRYRWWLSRDWAIGARVLWIMLNPSKADHEIDDPTIVRVTDFTARTFGAAGFSVCNLYSWRATRPRELKHAVSYGHDIYGSLTDATIIAEASLADTIVLAYGQTGPDRYRAKAVQDLLWDRELLCLGTTQSGHPRHPLMLRKDTQPQVFRCQT